MLTSVDISATWHIFYIISELLFLHVLLIHYAPLSSIFNHRYDFRNLLWEDAHLFSAFRTRSCDTLWNRTKTWSNIEETSFPQTSCSLYSHWLIHSRKVIRTLKTTVLMKSSLRHRTVTETKFTFGSADDDMTKIKLENKQTFKTQKRLFSQI